MAKILIVDDDKQICRLSEKIAGRIGHQSVSVHNTKDALKLCLSENYDLVLLDLELPDGSGLSILSDLLKAPSLPEVIIITGTGNIQGAELAFKYGAWDFIPKPIHSDEVRLSITRVLEYRKEKYAVPKPKLLSRKGIIGESPALQNCLEQVAHAAINETGVLITGETGTGKEMISRAIHNNSTRAEAPFIVVDCASLPESLIESVLFGHEKGSFTGASNSRNGLFKQAKNGTLFLDEVGELPPSMQKVFLRVLQEQCFRPVGSDVEIKSDFRLIAATNRDLDSMVNTGGFRMDLLYRLRSIEIQIPPLRERKEDIIALVLHHLEQKKISKGYAPEFIKNLQMYDWPGNVRELLNALDHTLTMAGDVPILYPIHLPPQIRLPSLKDQLTDEKTSELELSVLLLQEEILPPVREYRNTVLESIEKMYLVELMRRTQGQIKLACKISGLSKSRLHTLMNKYHTPRFRKNK